MADLEEIMAGRNSAPEPTPTPAQESPPPAQEPPQEAAPQQPQQDTDPNPENDPDPVTGLRKALDAERGKGRKYKETVESFERRMEAMQTQFNGVLQLLQAQQRQQPQQEQPKAPDLWDDPNAFVGNTVQQALNPVQQALDYNAQLIAKSMHTPEKVSEAEEAFMAAYRSGQLHPADYHRVVGSPNRYVAAVEWHNSRPENQRQILEAEIEKRILAQYGIQPGQTAPQSAPPPQSAPQTQNLPTSFAGHRSAGPRTTPQWSGPMALSDIMKR